MNNNYISTRIALSDKQISNNFEGFIRSEIVEDENYRWLVYVKVKNNKRHNEIKRKCNLSDKNGTVCDYVCIKKHIMINHVNCNKHKENEVTETQIIDKHAAKLGLYILMVYIY